MFEFLFGSGVGAAVMTFIFVPGLFGLLQSWFTGLFSGVGTG